MDNQNCYEARVFIPAELGPALWQLVGGIDCLSLRAGIIRACELAAENSAYPGNQHGRISKI